MNDFKGGISVRDLYRCRCRCVPPEPGVYCVVRKSSKLPGFHTPSTAGWFHGLDPSYPDQFVKDNWVRGAQIIYVGKAAGQNGLRQRICQLVKFGFGHAVGHRGGRLLWHLNDWETLQVFWLCNPNAADLETSLINQFREIYGERPFANLKK